MPWYALDAVDEAVDATREFLFPFDRSRWLRLAVIAVFVGGGGSAFNWAQEVPANLPSLAESAVPSPAVATETVVFALLAVLAVVVLGFVVAGPVMRFVLLDALRTDEVRIRTRFRGRLWDGLKLLLFSLGAGILLFTIAATLFAALTSGGLALAEGIPAASGGSFIGAFVILAAVVGGLGGLIGVAAFFHFTTAFVAPTMVATDRGVVAAWTRFFGVLRAERWQFIAYLLVRGLLGIAVTVVSTLATLLVGGLIALIAVFAGVAVTTPFGGLSAALDSTVGTVATGGVVVAAVIAFLALVWFPLRISFLTFYTTYELSMLGAADTELALLDGGGDEPDEPSVTDPDDTGGFQFGVVESEDAAAAGGGDVADDAPTDAVAADAAESPTDDDTADGRADDDGDDSSVPYWRD